MMKLRGSKLPCWLTASLLAQTYLAGSVTRSWLNASLLAQRLVAASAPRSWLNFFNEKKRKKKH